MITEYRIYIEQDEVMGEYGLNPIYEFTGNEKSLREYLRTLFPYGFVHITSFAKNILTVVTDSNYTVAVILCRDVPK